MQQGLLISESHNPICFTIQPYSVFAGIPVATNVAPTTSIPPDLWNVIHSSNSMMVRQHVKLLPKNCCSCPPCVKQTNTYSVYAGIGQDAQAEIMRLDEVSNDWNRCGCSPYHPLRVEARRYIPIPGDGSGSDYSHLSADWQRDLNNWGNRGATASKLKDLYKTQPVMFSMVRDGGQRCCACPCKWLSTFVCCSCCQDGVHIYAGDPPDEDANEPGMPYEPFTKYAVIGSVKQPICGGVCHPEIHLRDEGGASNEDSEPFAKIEGPCFFGGWSEMCCDFNFPVSYFKSASHTGDAGFIVKKRPSSMAQAGIQLFTESDVFSVNFSSNLTASQKVTLLAGQVLTDYMLFDGNTDKCRCDDDGMTCYLCYCMIFGGLCPCYIHIPNNKGGN